MNDPIREALALLDEVVANTNARARRLTEAKEILRAALAAQAAPPDTHRIAMEALQYIGGYFCDSDEGDDWHLKHHALHALERIKNAAPAAQAVPAVPEDVKAAVRWAPSSAYWSQRLVERMETTSEHIARDIREGRFPQRSEPQRVQATEWGPMPDAGVEADAHVAVIEGDEAVRVLRWNSDVGAFSYPVGTRLYAAQAPAADGDALDAARYRWLRSPDNPHGPSLVAFCKPDELDAAIDAAMPRTTGSDHD